MESYLFALALLSTSANISPTDIHCMAEAIYFESRGEPLLGQIAVGNVILNRVDSNKFPNTICKVVHQGVRWKGHIVRNKCQFSYYCDGIPETIKDAEAYVLASRVAVDVLVNIPQIMPTALHYHSIDVDPDWSYAYKYIGRIGKHEFYE
jgi:spore germination cell wall hydrolase CwlJ-like protein